MTKKQLNALSYEILGCAIEVHKQFGPGLLESVYQECMINELILRGFKVQVEQRVLLYYKGKLISKKYRLDLLVNNEVIVELKSVDYLIPLHIAQLLTYMKLSKKPKGLLINFNCVNIINGCRSLVNEFFAALPDR